MAIRSLLYAAAYLPGINRTKANACNSGVRQKHYNHRYEKLTKTNLKTGSAEPILLPKTDMLLFWLTGGTKLVIRPSGTEPKIKIYCGVVRKKFDSIPQAIKEGVVGDYTLLHQICTKNPKNRL